MRKLAHRGGTSRALPLGVTILTLAAVALPVATVLQPRDQSRIRHGLETSAYVQGTGIERSSGADGKKVTDVNVWFRPGAQPRIVKTTIRVPGRRTFEDSQMISVRYDPARPLTAELAGNSAVDWTRFDGELVGVLLLLAATAYLWRARGVAMRAAIDTEPAAA